MSEAVRRPTEAAGEDAGPPAEPSSPQSFPSPPSVAPRVAEQPRSFMRRLARVGASRPVTAAQLEPLFNAMRAHHPKVDTALLERAYRTAEHYHSGQTRKSGDSYIKHPLAVGQDLRIFTRMTLLR